MKDFLKSRKIAFQNRIGINGFRKEKDEPNKQYLEIRTGVLKLHNTCHNLESQEIALLLW